MMLMRQEGYKQHPYMDSTGNISIGYGRNLKAVGVSQGEALTLLGNDITKALTALNGALPWVSKMCEARQIGLSSLCFNLGINGLLKFKNMLLALKGEDWEKANEELLNSLGAKQAPNRYAEIAKIFLTGVL